MSLVIEAIGMATSERREYSTEECVASSTSAALERSAGCASEARWNISGARAPPCPESWRGERGKHEAHHPATGNQRT